MKVQFWYHSRPSDYPHAWVKPVLLFNDRSLSGIHQIRVEGRETRQSRAKLGAGEHDWQCGKQARVMREESKGRGGGGRTANLWWWLPCTPEERVTSCRMGILINIYKHL